ncbi:MAG TPA: phospholipase D-like domain-containing protein [Gemmatimonadaceae bacterium]|nr:phospholipase D-like domain-containing protein [Gemmatimonadaceae bacterium]
MYIALIIIGAIIIVFAFIGIEYSLRGIPIARVTAIGDADGPPCIGEPLFERTAELFTGATLHEGNDVRVLVNGDETYPSLWEDLRSARHSITLQTYFCKEGRMAEQLADIIMERSRAGVRVLFLFDAFGAQDLSEGYLDRLREAGVRVASFRPVHWYSLHKAQHRSHIRVVVVDGCIGYTGGFGIDDNWFGDGKSEDQWRDTNVRFTGPAVAQLQATFTAGWVEATGELITGELFFPEIPAVEGTSCTAALFHSAPTIGSTPAARFVALTIASARECLYITNSYFVPDEDIVEILVRAARRGVDVRILTAGPTTDVKLARWAGRGRYHALLEGGVRIYEYQPAMMHAKTLVADSLWSSIGTMNFDNRSLVFNDESNLLVLDPGVGSKMNTLFHADLRSSREITLPEFENRGFLAKGAERMALLLSRLL